MGIRSANKVLNECKLIWSSFCPYPFFRLAERFAKDHMAGKYQWDLNLEPLLIIWNQWAYKKWTTHKALSLPYLKGFKPGAYKGKLTVDHADEALKATPLMNSAQRPQKSYRKFVELLTFAINQWVLVCQADCRILLQHADPLPVSNSRAIFQRTTVGAKEAKMDFLTAPPPHERLMKAGWHPVPLGSA